MVGGGGGKSFDLEPREKSFPRKDGDSGETPDSTEAKLLWLDVGGQGQIGWQLVFEGGSNFCC